MFRRLTGALLTAAVLVGCGRYPDEELAYHTERFGPDRGLSPLPATTAKPVAPPEPPPPGGAELFQASPPPQTGDAGSDAAAPPVQPDGAPPP
jgi:hypothetical protein